MTLTQIKTICMILLCFAVSCGQPAERPAAAIQEISTEATVAPAAIAEAPAPEYSKEEIASDGLTENADGEETEEVDAASDEHIQEDSNPVKPTITEKKIIRNGSMSVKANDLQASKKRIDATLKKLGAYYQDERFSNEDSREEYFLKIRIPSNQFENLIHSIDQGNDEIVSKQLNAEDVTEEFVDLEARLLQKREYLERYKSILRAAKNVKEMMQVEENIRNLQEEIESKEGRLRFLKDQVSYSTLDLTLFHPKEYVFRNDEENSFSERAKAAFSGGWHGVVELCLGLFTVWPFLLFLFLVYVFIRTYLKRRKAKQTNIEKQDSENEKES